MLAPTLRGFAATMVLWSVVVSTVVVSAVAVAQSDVGTFADAATATEPAVRGEQFQVEPPPPPPSLSGCPPSERAAVVDKAAQRFWLCEDGVSTTDELPMTTASAGYGLPPVGTHHVFAKDRIAFGLHGERLHRFVAFYVTPRNNRIAFHQYVNQDPATIGDLDQRGQSAGCLRVLPDHSVLVWDFLEIGDPVVVISN